MKRNNAAEYARKMLGIDQEAEQGQAVQPEQPEQPKEEVKAEGEAVPAKRGRKPRNPGAKKYHVNFDATEYRSYLSIMADVQGDTVTGYIRKLIEADMSKPENKAVFEAISAFKAAKAKE